jgi:hypothetical protein
MVPFRGGKPTILGNEIMHEIENYGHARSTMPQRARRSLFPGVQRTSPDPDLLQHLSTKPFTSDNARQGCRRWSRGQTAGRGSRSGTASETTHVVTQTTPDWLKDKKRPHHSDFGPHARPPSFPPDTPRHKPNSSQALVPEDETMSLVETISHSTLAGLLNHGPARSPCGNLIGSGLSTANAQ